MQTRKPPFQGSELPIAAGNHIAPCGTKHPTVVEFCFTMLTWYQAAKALFGRALVVMWGWVKTSTCPFMIWEGQGQCRASRGRERMQNDWVR